MASYFFKLAGAFEGDPNSSSRVLRSIVFDQAGAINFSDEIYIEIATDPFEHNGMTEAVPYEVWCELNRVKHIVHILERNFLGSCGRIPHISDVNESLPVEKRWTKMYVRCTRKYYHFDHIISKGSKYVDMTLKEAMDYVIKNKMSIQAPIDFRGK